jgi:UDP-N-acetylmuramoyl-L-alanyl-D-glutamate--2,6-diaminopimelate ligase
VRLSDLARAASATLVGADLEVDGIAADSRQVRAGHLFVAIPGARADGARFIPEALRRGAVAVCAKQPADSVPTLVVPDPRGALAALAAAFYRHPARELTLIGLTGSLGKTSTALLIEAALTAAGGRVGVIGSLGIRFEGAVVETGMTTPEAPAIHAALRRIVDQGATATVMEVTSHSILLQRVAGLQFHLGALTNIVPYEHLEFHPTPQHYVQTKARFFDMLVPGAPLVVNVDDRTAREVTSSLAKPVVGVTLRGRPEARVSAERVRMTPTGSEFAIRVLRPLPRLGGGEVEPVTLSVRLPILGRQQVANATVAATTSMIAGAPPEAVAVALAGAEPMHRRMQIIYDDGPVVLDDTVGNPESIRAVFDAVRSIPHDRLRIAFAVRGARGVDVNELNAAALAEGVAATGASLVVTSSEDAAGPRDRVAPEERDAVIETLRRAGVDLCYEPTLEAAVRAAVTGADRGDLVLLLGAQGMDAGAGIARDVLGARTRGS